MHGCKQLVMYTRCIGGRVTDFVVRRNHPDLLAPSYTAAQPMKPHIWLFIAPPGGKNKFG